jgi:hypothetical protein
MVVKRTGTPRVAIFQTVVRPHLDGQ